MEGWFLMGSTVHLGELHEGIIKIFNEQELDESRWIIALFDVIRMVMEKQKGTPASRYWKTLTHLPVNEGKEICNND